MFVSLKASLQKVALHCKILNGRREADFFCWLRERKFYEKNNISHNVLHLQTSATTRSASGLCPRPPAALSASWLTPVTSAMVSTRGLCVLTSPDVFQWAAAAGSCGCGQWTSRAAGARAWTACAARTTGGSTQCPASTPGGSCSSIVTVFLNVMSLLRILHIAVSSIHKEALAYKVSWITSGPLKPDSLHFQVSVLRKFDVCLSVLFNVCHLLISDITASNAKSCPKVLAFKSKFSCYFSPPFVQLPVGSCQLRSWGNSDKKAGHYEKGSFILFKKMLKMQNNNKECMVWFFALPNALDAAWSIVIKTLKSLKH